MGRKDKKETSWSGHLLNLGLVAVLVIVVFLPESPIRTRLAAWRAQARLSVLVEEHWQALAATSARMDKVDASAAMIIEFGDYECPFCRDSHAHLEAVMESHPEATIGFRHYPLTAIHLKAEAAAHAAICAEEQGRFREGIRCSTSRRSGGTPAIGGRSPRWSEWATWLHTNAV